MIDLDIKINKIEKNCIELAKKEAKALKEENDLKINEAKDNLLDDYKDVLAKKYVQDLEYLKKEYNKRVFEYEVQERKKINILKDNLKNKIKNSVEDEIKEFVGSRSYKKYLTNNIESLLSKLKKDAKCTVYVTKRDYDKYGSKLLSNYKNAKLDKIEDENLGGCKVLDITNKVLIDNTLKNNISEILSKIDFE